MTADNTTPIERIGMVVFGALVVIAMPVLGLINTLGGSMSGMFEYVNGEESGYALSQAGVPEAADLTAAPIIAPNSRAILLAVALLVLGLLAVYRLRAVSGAA